MKRRSFLLGLTGALAAPAVVRAESLMKIWVPPKPRLEMIEYPPPDQSLVVMLERLERVRQEVFDLHTFGSTWRRTYYDTTGKEILSEYVPAEQLPILVNPVVWS